MSHRILTSPHSGHSEFASAFPAIEGHSWARRSGNTARAAILVLLVCTLEGIYAQRNPSPATPGVVQNNQTAASPEALENNPVIVAPQGLQIRSISTSMDYYSSGLANTAGPTATPFRADAAAGGSAEIGWLRAGERTTTSFSYTSSLSGRMRYSELNAWNHAFSLSASHHLTPRAIFSFSARGDLSNLEQSLFSSTTMSSIASSRSTLDDLAGGMLASKFSNPQLTSLFNSASLLESPLRSVLYGQRMFTTAAKASVLYSYSPRLSLSVDAGGGRNQYLSGTQTQASLSSYAISNTTSAHAGFSASYSLSPRTRVGGSVSTERIVSSLQDSYTTTPLATMSRELARRWLLELHGGVGVLNPVGRPSFSFTTGRQLVLTTMTNPAGGASLAFKANSQTILSSVDRAVSDTYGLGAATTTSAAVSWHWKRPGRAWWMESGAGWQQLQGNGLARLSGLRTTAGLGRSLSRQLVFFTQYAYLDYSLQLQTGAYRHGQSAVRVSLTWSPHGEVSR